MTPPVPPERPEDPREGPSQQPDHEALWQSIVDNFGERAQLDDPPPDAPAAPEPPAGGAFPEVAEPAQEPDPAPRRESDDHFVPPPPPPLPRPTPARLLAWLGLFGVPALVLVSMVTGLRLPGWSGLVLMVWFVGGFVYLVASMQPRNDQDGYDDGAVL